MRPVRAPRKRLFAAGLTAATLASLMAVTTPAPAALNARIIAGPGAFLPNVTYLTPVAVMQKGGSAAFTNYDIVLHDVRSSRFYTKLVGLGQTANVVGAKKLPKGIYPFKCSLHPWMKGNLRVI